MATALNGVTAVSASSETTDHTSWESDHGLVLSRNHNYDGFYRGNASTEPAPADPLMFLTLDFAKTSRLPLYLQIAQHIQSAIESDDLTPGTQLGNEIELAKRIGVSRPTMRRAIQTLVDMGMLVRRRGVGTQVVHGATTRPMKLTGLFDDLIESGQEPRTIVLRHQVLPASKQVAKKLNIAPGETILYLHRLRSAQREPLAIMENYLPEAFADFDEDELRFGGLYQAMRRNGVKMATATQRIGARNGTAEECRLLEEPTGSPLLTVDRLAFDDSGQPIEWGQHLYRSANYTFSITLVR